MDLIQLDRIKSHDTRVQRLLTHGGEREERRGEETPRAHACEYGRGRVSVETIIIQAGIT